MKYAEIKQMHQEKMNALFNECHVFWAFSNEQFSDGAKLHPLKEGEKYVSIGAGGYLPKGYIDRLTSGMKELSAWKKAEIKKEKNAMEEHILYELNNHECYYTGSIEDAMAVLPYDRKDVLKVFRAHHEEEMAKM